MTNEQQIFNERLFSELATINYQLNELRKSYDVISTVQTAVDVMVKLNEQDQKNKRSAAASAAAVVSEYDTTKENEIIARRARMGNEEKRNLTEEETDAIASMVKAGIDFGISLGKGEIVKFIDKEEEKKSEFETAKEVPVNEPKEVEIKKSDLKDYGEQGGAYTHCPNCNAMEIGNLAYEYCEFCSCCGVKFKWL